MKWTAENQRRAGVAGGIEAIVKAMTTHIDNADVCQRGCGAFCGVTVSGKKH